MKSRLLLLAAILCISSIQITFAEEVSPPNEEYFKPLTMVGSSFFGRVQAESNVIVNATLWRTAPGAYNSNFYASTEYQHQTMEATENGGCMAAVRYFDDADFNSAFGNVESTQTTTLKGRKAYMKDLHPTVARPGKYSPIDIAMLDVDIDDPFRHLLPKKSLKKDLTWEPEGEAIKSILRKGNTIRAASRGEEKRVKAEAEGKKNGDEKKEALDGVLEERGGGPGGWDRDWKPPEIQYTLDFTITQATASVEKFGLDGFSARVDFTGTLNVPLTQDRTEIPFNGVITFEYDTVNKALKQGELQVSASWEGKVKFWRSEIPVKVDWKEKYSYYRENRPVNELAKGVQAESRVFGSSSSDAPVLVAAIKDGLVLLANWDGSGAYEVLNSGTPVKGEQSLPTAGAVSSDGVTIVLAIQDKLLASTDAGLTFKPIPWKVPVKSISFLNSPRQIAIMATEDGEFYRLECLKKIAPKKLSGPIAGKKILLACSGPDEDGLYVVIPDGYYYCTDGSKFRKILSMGDPPPVCMTRCGTGVVILSNILQFLSPEDGKDITALNIPEKVIFMDATDKVLVLLNSAGELFTVPIEGGDVTMLDKDVKNVACGFKKIFIAKDNGIVIK